MPLHPLVSKVLFKPGAQRDQGTGSSASAGSLNGGPGIQQARQAAALGRGASPLLPGLRYFPAGNINPQPPSHSKQEEHL